MRREHINAVLERTLFGHTREIALPRQQLAQHRDLGIVSAAGRHPGIAFDTGLLVGPVRRHAMLGVLVHGMGSKLDFNGPPSLVAHHRVQGLVAVGFGFGNVVVKLLGHRREVAVHPAQGSITVRHAGHDDAQRTDVVHLRKSQRLAAHFLDNAVNVFGPSLHGGNDALRLEFGFDALAQLPDLVFAFGALFIEQACHLMVSLRLQKTKRQVFEFPLEFADVEPVGQRCKNLQRFLRQAARRRAFAGSEKAQCLQSRCQSQQHHAQVTRKRQQHFAHILGLHGRALRQRRCLRRCRLGLARLTLHAHQLGGLERQRGKVFTKSVGNHVLRLLQMLAGVNQITRRLHGA